MKMLLELELWEVKLILLALRRDFACGIRPAGMGGLLEKMTRALISMREKLT
jgi:hypothetical protein